MGINAQLKPATDQGGDKPRPYPVRWAVLFV